MIWVFDSGLWGIQTLRYIVDALPQYSYCYLGDTAWLPYGTKDPQWIHDRTFACCERLFAHGCHLVILACNSASTYAIRSRQQHYPERKMLSVTVPGVEAVVSKWFHHIGVMGTKATVESNLYPSFFERHFPDYNITIEQVIGGELVTMIESGASADLIDQECKRVVAQFSDNIETVILGCTHYPIIEELLQKHLPAWVSCINPAKEAASRLADYIERHPELLEKKWTPEHTEFYVTKDIHSFQEVGSRIWGNALSTKVVEI